MDALAGRLVRLAGEGELAVVFGREDSGLTDDELDRCTHLVYLPSADPYPSINLAQSVMLVAYTLRMASLGAPERESVGTPAVHHEREEMYSHLSRALLAIGFLTPDTREVMMRRFRRIFGRAELSREEVKMLRGVARQTLWLAGRAGLPVPPEIAPAGSHEEDREESS
jgi:TrmH family RNA methyltransferase